MMIPLLWLSMGFVGIIYFLVGLLSYIVWPTVTAGSISAELAATKGGVALSICSWCSMFAVMLTFPVQVIPDGGRVRAARLPENPATPMPSSHSYGALFTFSQLFPALELLELRLGFTESSVQRRNTGTFTRLDDGDGDGEAGGRRESGGVEMGGVVVHTTTMNALRDAAGGGGGSVVSGSEPPARHAPGVLSSTPSKRGSAVFATDGAAAYADTESYQDGEDAPAVQPRPPTENGGAQQKPPQSSPSPPPPLPRSSPPSPPPPPSLDSNSHAHAHAHAHSSSGPNAHTHTFVTGEPSKTRFTQLTPIFAPLCSMTPCASRSFARPLLKRRQRERIGAAQSAYSGPTRSATDPWLRAGRRRGRRRRVRDRGRGKLGWG